MKNDNNNIDNNNSDINNTNNDVLENTEDWEVQQEDWQENWQEKQEDWQIQQEDWQEKQKHKIDWLSVPIEKFNRMSEIERLEIEKQKKEQKKGKEKKEKDKDENELVVNDYNFIISHNVVLFVNAITKKEINAWWKYNFWQNHKTGETVQILDKDYWKSAELMRSLVEEDYDIPLWKKILVFSIIFFVLIIVVIIVYSIFIPDEKPTIPTKNVTQQIIPWINNNQPKVETPITPAPTNFNNTATWTTQTWQILQTTNATTVFQDSQLSIEIMKKDYEIQSLTLEYERLTKENNLLIEENTKITNQNKEKDLIISQNKILIEDLEKKLKEFTNIPKNLSQEAFIINLGTQIYNKCEKWDLSEVEKVNCKELYFNFVKQ